MHDIRNRDRERWDRRLCEVSGKRKPTLNQKAEQYENMDDTFSFIAGYTSGGAAYGVTWEEAGIDPELPFEEKVALLYEQNNGNRRMQIDDLPF